MIVTTYNKPRFEAVTLVTEYCRSLNTNTPSMNQTCLPAHNTSMHHIIKLHLYYPRWDCPLLPNTRWESRKQRLQVRRKPVQKSMHMQWTTTHRRWIVREVCRNKWRYRLRVDWVYFLKQRLVSSIVLTKQPSDPNSDRWAPSIDLRT